MRAVGHPELFTPETVTKALASLYALGEFEEQFEIVKAEIARSRPERLEELNRQFEELLEGESEEEET